MAVAVDESTQEFSRLRDAGGGEDLKAESSGSVRIKLRTDSRMKLGLTVPFSSKMEAQHATCG